MSNIAIINYCNLRCPYCFANRYITEEEKQVITMEQLDYILDFLGKTDLGRVGIIGGEPTLHPQFPAILERIKSFCEEHHCTASLFTNGIRLYEYIRLIDRRVGCLVNVNHPDVVGDNNWRDMIRGLDRALLRSSLHSFNLGINLYPTISDYSYIFDLALKYRKDHLRVSYVAPTCNFSHVDKDEYYNEAKEIFIKFVEKSKSYGLHINLDCNHVPRCYFTEEELQKIDRCVSGFRDVCEPVLDITPDFKGTACFGAYELVDLHQFKDTREAESYLREKKLSPRATANCGGKCGECQRHIDHECQGGCLAFTNA